jgi:hypothetical protein
MNSVLNDTTLVVVAGVCLLIVILGSGVIFKVRPKQLDLAKFQERWQEVQNLCRSSNTWPMAVINADKLLDEALKKTKCKGNTMGERLVFAQRMLSHNDNVWFGHKLRNKIVHEEMPKLHKRDVQAALRGFREALRDLGALE